MRTQHPISVFLVDDEKTYLTALEHYLNGHFKSKIQTDTFTDGRECINALESKPTIDLVVLDHYLTPGGAGTMDGLDVLRKIKQINPEVIVVMLSAEDKLTVATDCINNGAFEYVVKSETAFLRVQNIIKNLLHEIGLRPYYPVDIGGEA
jgi:DNA-binding NtrC family response regulator